MREQTGLQRFAKSGFVMLLLALFVATNAWADQFDTLRLYWQNQLTGTNNGSSTLNSRASTASSYWSSMNTNASRTCLWSDLPLGSDSGNVDSTFGQLRAMALAWATPGCSLKGNAGLASAITNGLDWMCAHCYTTTAMEYGNWWDWEIGGMQDFNDAVVLIYPALTAAQIHNYTASADHFGPDGSGATYGWMTGANLTDKCKDVFIRAIIGKSSGKMTEAQTNLGALFPYVTSGDGFYLDGSFIQHTSGSHGIAYTGTYGEVLLSDIAQLINLLNGSAWQITDPNSVNVYSWVSDSFEPLIYHGAMMDMVRGRAISRSSETESSDGSGTIGAVRQIAQFAPTTTAMAFSNWANAPTEPPGQYQFASMDRAVAWRHNFCLGLSMSSTRIANYECINGENLHGWFTGDGMTYLYLGNPDTQFTGDFWATVDAYHLPGTTVQTSTRANAVGENSATSQNWVGGAQIANAYGSAGMSLAAYGTTLVGKKSWFMLDNEIVCLGAGITCGDLYEVDTTVENRRLGTAPSAHFTVDGTSFPPTMGWSSNLTGVTWCSLDGVAGYYFPGSANNLRAAFVAQSGSWSQVNSGGSTHLYTDDYLTLWFNHGVRPSNASYAYVILPNFTALSMTAYAANPDVVVLTNSAVVQAVKKPSLGIMAANFWTNGNSSVDFVSVNNKSSVITWETSSNLSVGISDPTQTNRGSITVTLNRAASSVLNADSGVTVLQLSPQIIFSVNVNAAHGRTFQSSFQSVPNVTLVQPSLSLQLLPGAVQLSWPSSSASWQLQYKTNFLDTGWQTLSGTITNPWIVPMDPSVSAVFYRLLLNTN